MEPLPSAPSLLVVGEILADFIADEHGQAIASSGSFRRVLGGSAANVAVAYAHLGGSVSLVGAVGDGPTGSFLVDELRRHGVDPRGIRRLRRSSTMVFVDRGRSTPEFEIVRGADRWIRPGDVASGGPRPPMIVHTSAFALSRPPARATILDLIARHAAEGGSVSLDLNYERSVWGGRSGRSILAAAVAMSDFVKASRDDLHRLLGDGIGPEQGMAALMGWGARNVVVTLGRDGAWFRTGADSGHVPASAATAVDTTGAGDAFWAGVLRGLSLGAAMRVAVGLGTRVAARKIRQVGPLSDDVDAVAELAELDARA